MRFLFLILLCVGVFSYSGVVHAQSSEQNQIDNTPNITKREIEKWKRGVDKRDAAYKEQVSRLRERNADFFPGAVQSLRSLYAYTSFYTPFSDALIDQMTEHAYVVETSKDSVEINRNLNRYRTILNLHIVNMGVLDFAITMARVNPKFGSSQYYENIRKYILDKIETPENDGLSPQTAFHIISQQEEIHMLSRIGGDVGKSEIYDVNGIFYNVYDVTLENGDFTQIFMNVTQPIKNSYIKKIAIEGGAKLDLPNLR